MTERRREMMIMKRETVSKSVEVGHKLVVTMRERKCIGTVWIRNRQTEN